MLRLLSSICHKQLKMKANIPKKFYSVLEINQTNKKRPLGLWTWLASSVSQISVFPEDQVPLFTLPDMPSQLLLSAPYLYVC